MSIQASVIQTLELETARLILRTPRFDDAPEMARLADRKSVV